MSQFPQPYKEILKQSKLTHEQIAHQLHLSKRRWSSIFYGQAKMDVKEFGDIKRFVENIQRKGVSNV